MFLLWCDRLVFISLSLLIFVLPATIGGVSIFFVAAIVFFLVGKVAGGFRAWQEGRGWLNGLRAASDALWLSLPVVFFIVINFLAVLWSQYPEQSRKAFVGKVIGHVLLYLAARETVNSPRRLMVLARVMCVSAILISLDALLQLWTGQDLFKGAPLITGRVSAAFNHPNGLGAYLVLALPVMFALLVNCWGKRHCGRKEWAWILLAGSGLLLGLSVLGLTFSRGAWIGFVAAGAAFLLLDRKLPAILFMAITATALFIFVPLLKSSRHVSLVSENVAPVASVQNVSSEGGPVLPVVLPAGEAGRVKGEDWIDRQYVKLVQVGIGGSDRLIYWRDAIKIVRDHPWTGTGLNTYAKTIKKYNSDRALYAHNGYLQMAAELGIFGLAIFMWFLISHLFNGIRTISRIDPSIAVLWTAIVSSFIGFLVNGFFDTTFYSVQHRALLWFFLGLLACGQVLVPRRDEGARS